MEISIVSDIITILFVIISIIIGIRIISHYFENKRIVFITIGLTWIFLCAIWFDDVIIFLLFKLPGHSISDQLSNSIDIIGDSLIVPASIAWAYSFCILTSRNSLKIKFPLFILILGVLYIISSFIFNVLAIEGDIIIFYQILSNVYLIFLSFLFLITGYLFANETRRSEDQKIKYKGIFLFLAFVVFIIGALIKQISSIMFINYEAIATNEYELLQLLGGIILIISSILYYFGYFLPEKFVKRIIKEA